MEALHELGRLHGLAHGVGKRGLDVGGQALGGEKGHPLAVIGFDAGFLHRGQVGQQRITRGIHEGQPLDVILIQRSGGGGVDLHAVPRDGLEGVGVAGEGDVADLRPGLLEEVHHGEVGYAAHAGRREEERVGVGLHIPEHVVKRVPGRGLGDHDDVRSLEDTAHEVERIQRIRNFAHVGVHGQRRARGYAEGITVGLGPGDGAYPGDAGCAYDVLHDHDLLEFLAHAVREHTGHEVGFASGREGHDDGDRAVRERIGGHGGAGHEAYGGEGEQQLSEHGTLLGLEVFTFSGRPKAGAASGRAAGRRKPRTGRGRRAR